MRHISIEAVGCSNGFVSDLINKNEFTGNLWETQAYYRLTKPNVTFLAPLIQEATLCIEP
jgi:hypothetical protein